ncbi:ABC transporter substrate-binding protein [Pseudarthrobacter sp. fls2-241-R2A-168]|uniref:ABC transporter substrate-binding protein n=1 Tax=Pseudarthrobacter sp. fls2-241-R2A-168 TaxID=3040304 RepID=UPI0025534A1B|nr:ABC transporter substrate-binding protein [Pseudarthrobacter sp. fls2-241-R2A-168]
MRFKPIEDHTTTTDGKQKRDSGAKRGHVLLSAVSLMAGAAIVLAGCSARSQSAPDNSAGPDSTAEMDRAATFVWGAPVAPTMLDPHKTPNSQDALYLRPVYDTLVSVGNDGTLSPQLAKEWKFTDDSTLMMTLREGVTFSDGEPFDAEAVVANIEAGKAGGPQQQAALASITSVKAADTATVVLSLGEKRGTTLGQLATMAGMMVSPKAIKSGDLASTSAGTGPYQITSVRPDEVDLQRSESSWVKDQAGAAVLKMKVVPDQQSRLNQLKSGEITATNTDLKSFKALGPGFHKAAAAEYGQLVMPINQNGVFKSVDARRAVDLAMDRAAVLNATYGEGEPNVQLFPKSHPVFVPDLEHGADVEEAKRLAESSGLAGKTIRLLSLNVSTTMAVSEGVAGMLEKVGAKVEIVPVEATVHTQEWGTGKYDLTIIYNLGHPDPAVLFQNLIGENAVLNLNGAPPASVAEPLAAALNTAPSEERTKTLQAVAKAITEDETVLSVMHTAIQVVGGKSAVGLRPYQTGLPSLRGVGVAAK